MPRRSRLRRRSAFALLFAAFLLEIAAEQPEATAAEGVVAIGTIEHFAIAEGSGLAASRQYPGVIWTHNDGGFQFLFALTETGSYLGAFQVVGANLIDWEALAPDDRGNLYLADIGFDGMARTHVAIHRVREPKPSRRYGNAEVSKTWFLRFPGSRPDCEAFFVHQDYGYLITKPRINGQVTLYRYPLSSDSSSILLQEVTKISVVAAVTDAALSQDSERLGLLSSQGAYLFSINGNVERTDWTSPVFAPFAHEFVEGGTFVDKGFLVSAETRELWLFTNSPFRTVIQAPRLVARAGTATNSIRIEFNASTGYSYFLEARDDLTGGSWVPTGDSFQATNNVGTFFDDERTAHARFYRLRVTRTRDAD